MTLSPRLIGAQRQREDQQRAHRHHRHLPQRDPPRHRDLLVSAERLEVLHPLELALRHADPHALRHERDDERRDAVRDVQAVGIGALHGLAGTGAVVLLLIAALPTQLEAALALALFAPMSIVSMAACTAAFAWVLTRPIVEPVYRTVLIPGLGLFGVMFGLWYAGLA